MSAVAVEESHSTTLNPLDMIEEIVVANQWPFDRSNNDELVLNKREVETNVVVDDGEMVVLGGLLDQSNEARLEKIPLLGDIPGLGALFRSTARERNKTNLMVFIRPTIVRDAAQAQAVTAPRYDYMRARQLDSGGTSADGRTMLDTLVRDYFGTTPPVMPPPALAPVPATTDDAQP